MPLLPGTRLGPYEILAPIGAGGMGEVFRARDTRLRRDVAIKVLPASVANDDERVARFRREAQMLAALNHSNIAGIYGLEEDAATSVVALAMEFVEGEDLAERLRRGPLPTDEAVAIAKQIAEALEEAHERGIIHRDLKPANVKVTPDGKVKVLDFGLAKALEVEPVAGERVESGTQSPTMSRHGTEAGVIMGSVAYMSPEQARGKKVDKRSDIWSFGVVLHEMLTGERLFSGETTTDMLAAVLTREVDFSKLPPKTPSRVTELLRRCLDRNVKNRLHDIGDARVILEEVLNTGIVGASAPRAEAPPLPSVRPRAHSSKALVLVLFLLGLTLGAWLGRGSFLGGGTAPATFQGLFEISPPEKTLFVSGLAISNDGQRIAFVARGDDGRTRLYVRSIDEAEAKELTGTVDARYPFWAPDGRRIGFFAQNKLRVTDLLGGPPRAIADTVSSEDVRGGAWGADDRIVFAPRYSGPLLSVAATGGAPVPATEISGTSGGTHRFPCFLPDGRRFVYFGSSGTGDEPGELYLGRLGEGALTSKKLGPVTSSAIYVDPGYLLYVQGESLVAHRFDLGREELTGDPIPLGVALPGSVSVAGQRSLAASRTGLLVYRADRRSATRLVWVDREGRELKSIATEADAWYYGPTLSPNGRMLAVSHHEPGSKSGGIWIHDLERDLVSHLSADDKSDASSLAWSPDGRELAYASENAGDGGRINRVSVTAPGRTSPMVVADTFIAPNAWLANGKAIIYSAFDKAGRSSLMMRTLSENAQAVPLRSDPVSEFGAAVSPDGRWVALQADTTRRMEVYLRRLDDVTGGSTIRISSEGGIAPRFRRDGRELFYLADSGKMMSVPMTSTDPPQPGTPVPLFDARLESGTDRQYDVSLDGTRFVLNRTLTQEKVPISVLINWQERLGRAR